MFRLDAESVAIVHKLSARFAIEASVRDRERHLPIVELDEFADEDQKRYDFGKALQGYCFGKFFPESKSENARAFETRIRFYHDSGLSGA
ncbi:MAG: hypothetical protein KKC24_11260 [Gammaproteobacteria bacterium]|uniref:hypothetical protein n=1 Tax=Pseudomonas mandelii TaxID=75612 RepID=UPI0018A6BBBE|nr:hypothetical protein [Gammaproteobacteria bacterium]MBU0819418.1 hypothetical protein [Gammaproteobacteria bacterium]MBU0843348.1 hypothetical protein [Gammaproteobacteria bacterium]MBU1838585.1 hypothetical protein [Gammaproteobacteria bacterium]